MKGLERRSEGAKSKPQTNPDLNVQKRRGIQRGLVVMKDPSSSEVCDRESQMEASKRRWLLARSVATPATDDSPTHTHTHTHTRGPCGSLWYICSRLDCTALSFSLAISVIWPCVSERSACVLCISTSSWQPLSYSIQTAMEQSFAVDICFTLVPVRLFWLHGMWMVS